MTDYTKRCEGPATYGVLVISICIQLPVLYTYGVTLFQDVVCYQP